MGEDLVATGELVENFRISKVLAFRGLEREPIEIAEAGDIISIAGLTERHRSQHDRRSLRSASRSGRSRSTPRPSP